jgi:hypothetical protein
MSTTAISDTLSPRGQCADSCVAFRREPFFRIFPFLLESLRGSAS